VAEDEWTEAVGILNGVRNSNMNSTWDFNARKPLEIEDVGRIQCKYGGKAECAILSENESSRRQLFK